MKFFKKNFWTICSWVAVFALVAAGAVVEYATGDSVNDKFGDSFGNSVNY